MIEMSERTVAMWCIELGRDGNWLAHLSRTEKAGKLALDYRFRYYVDELIDRSKDRRNWYSGELSGRSESEVLTKMRRVFEEMLERTPGRRGWELLRGQRSIEEFAAALQAMPGIHVGKPEGARA